jgi:hypothetical protein
MEFASWGEEAVGGTNPSHESLEREYEADKTGGEGGIKEKLKGLQNRRIMYR